MVRPRVTVYNETSVDGRLEGFEQDAGRYYRLGFRWRSDAILMGSVTAQNFGPAESSGQQAKTLPAPDRLPVFPGFEALVYEPRPLLVVPDSRGAVRNWPHALVQPWYRSVVVLVSKTTPPGYLEYLERRGIEHLVAGEDRVDLPFALDQLHTRYGVQAVRTDCGGALNGVLLAAGVVDELAVIINPSVCAKPGAQSWISLPPTLTASVPSLTLVEVDRLEDGAVWLRYQVGQ